MRARPRRHLPPSTCHLPFPRVTSRSASAACGRARVELQRRHRDFEAARADHSRLSGKSGPSAAQFAERVARARAKRDGCARDELLPVLIPTESTSDLLLKSYTRDLLDRCAREREKAEGEFIAAREASLVSTWQVSACVSACPPVHVSQTRLPVSTWQMCTLHAPAACATLKTEVTRGNCDELLRP